MTAPRPAEEIRLDLGQMRRHESAPLLNAPGAVLRLALDVEPLMDRLAAVERERDEARAENQRHEVFMRAIKDCREDPASAIALNDIINGKAIIDAEIQRVRAEAAEARLAAVEKIADEIDRQWDSWWARQIRAVLADAPVPPQPEPGAIGFPEPPAGMKWVHPADGRHSDPDPDRFDCGHWFLIPVAQPQPERCEHGATEAHLFWSPELGVNPICPGPVPPGTKTGRTHHHGGMCSQECATDQPTTRVITGEGMTGALTEMPDPYSNSALIIEPVEICNGRDPAYPGERCPLSKGHPGGCFGDVDSEW